MNDTASNPPVLQLQDLRFAWPDQPALVSSWSLRVGPGVTQLYGDSGCGKSTLLRVMAGVLPAGGLLSVAGVRLDVAPAAYRKQIFFCDVGEGQFDQLAVRECTARLREGDAGFDEDRWQALVEGFSLAPHLDKSMFMLSTGSKRKVALAVALASGRALVLLDEPTSGLDAPSTRCLWRAVTEFAALPGRAVLVASAARIDAVALAATIEL